MLNQLGAALGVALVTLVVQTAAGPIGGLRGVFWIAVATKVSVLALVPLLPGRAGAPTAVRDEELVRNP
ncbi:hypothetical protein [Nonomuraea sp. NPDC049709]|uniref:hypothetical protein n=1 Tax=Nonomuraea sp. NPDC049709 TaxID=3154736 RepID=UPI00341C5D2E